MSLLTLESSEMGLDVCPFPSLNQTQKRLFVFLAHLPFSISVTLKSTGVYRSCLTFQKYTTYSPVTAVVHVCFSLKALSNCSKLDTLVKLP